MAGRGRPRKVLTKEQILGAMKNTNSNRAASRYLHVSFDHYKKYAKLFKDEESGKTLWEVHKNQAGKGISKFFGTARGEPVLDQILSGEVPHYQFNPKKLKARIIFEGKLEEKCYECGFSEKRVLDYKVPLILHFKDGNKHNYLLDNLQFLCYNCYFLYIGDVFSGRTITAMEDYNESITTKNDKHDFDLDEDYYENMQNYLPETESTGSSLIAYD